MNKCLCGNDFIEAIVNYKWKSEFLGTLYLDGVIIYKCNHCNTEMIPFATAMAMDKKEEEVLQQWLWGHCNDSIDFKNKFLSSTEAAKQLGLGSRQAVHKNLKYKGLIYHIFIEINGKSTVFFLKSSVKQFVQTGDGRFELISQHKNSKPFPHDYHKNSVDYNSCNDGDYINILKEN